MLSLIKIILMGMLSLLVVACDNSEYSALRTGNTINGTIVDGYIENATVCLDINKNNICDTTEPTTNSDKNGIFKFTNITLTENSFIPIIAYGGKDTAIDKKLTGEFRTILFSSNMDKNIIVSPLTDLITQSFLKRDGNSSNSLNDAKIEVASLFSTLDEIEILKDPMKDVTLFVETQKLQYAKDIIQKVLQKNIQKDSNSSATNLLQNNIKKELLTLDMDMKKVLISLATTYNISIPDNEVTFAEKQLQEVSKTITDISKSIEINPESLGRLQKSIDVKQTEALKALVDANSSSDTIPTTIIQISKENITKTMFNQSGDAILDTNACFKTDTMNILENSNANIIDDKKNGISLSSGYTQTSNPKDSLVTIFYPNIEARLADGDKKVIFKENYYFIFNTTWLFNKEKMVYILTPKNGDTNPICYRFELNNSLTNETAGTKVYRYIDLNL